MRKILFSLALVLGMVSASYAAIPVPTDKQNLQVQNPAWAGASTCDIGNSSGTQDVICATGKGVVFAVISTSGTSIPADFVTFRDSATANHTSTALFYAAGNFTPTVGPQFTNGLIATNSASAGTNEHYVILYRLQSNQN